jgi:hypothetical protein
VQNASLENEHLFADRRLWRLTPPIENILSESDLLLLNGFVGIMDHVFSDYRADGVSTPNSAVEEMNPLSLPFGRDSNYFPRKACEVSWKPDGAELVTPDGEKLFIPGKLILGRIGPAGAD